MRYFPLALLATAALINIYIFFQAGYDSRELPKLWFSYVVLALVFIVAPTYVFFVGVCRCSEQWFLAAILTGVLAFFTWYLGYYEYLHGDHTSRTFILPILWFLLWVAAAISFLIPRDASSNERAKKL